MSQRNKSRRRFLGEMASLIGVGGSAAMLGPLKLMNAALANSKGSTPYRALVCIYLGGGNDSFNLVVPNDAAGYASYATARGSLALAQNELLPVTPLSGGSYGFHPSCADLQSLFNSSELGVVSNIGPLVVPTSKLEYQAGAVALPPQLFSHSDQTRLWQRGRAVSNFNFGWGGLSGDRIQLLNPPSALAPVISISGQNVFQVGEDVVQYQMLPSGPVPLSGYADADPFGAQRNQALDDLLNLAYSDLFESESGAVLKRARELEAEIGAALDAAPALTTVFPASGSNSLADQLLMVAQMIQVRGSLGPNRQIFYVNLGGFDTHAAQLTDQPQLLGALSEAIGAFWNALVELGVQSQVTTFTMSEFARTLNSNGDGSDHAWGGNQLVLGGSVAGGTIHGSFPNVMLNGPDSLNRGQMIPTTAVEQLAAPLAEWVGVDPADIATVFPNLANFPAGGLPVML